MITVRGDRLNEPIPQNGGGTVVHAAAARGALGLLCLLRYAGASLDMLDDASRTPLIRALLGKLQS